MRKKLTVMVEEKLTSESKKKCIDMGISLSDLINRLLENYLDSVKDDSSKK